MSNLDSIVELDPDNIELMYELSQGKFGHVYESILKSKKLIVACKVITIANIDGKNPFLNLKPISKLFATLKKLSIPNGYQKFLTELKSLKEIQGENILKLIGYAVQEVNNLTNLMIITEFCQKGNLKDLLKREQNLSNLIRLKLSSDIAIGICYIHDLGLVHCDINEENILISGSYQAKISNLSSIETIGDKDIKYTKILPPEYFKNSFYYTGKYSEKLDIFMFGLTLNMIFGGITSDFIAFDEHFRIIKHAVCFEDLIDKCLQFNPEARPNANQIKEKFESCQKSLMDYSDLSDSDFIDSVNKFE